ncbi:MAG TPA: APC family permease [Casimicrobiaceae bacterium]|nr:APC family permease [Casimicrobiaceae bacterium]
MSDVRSGTAGAAETGGRLHRKLSSLGVLLLTLSCLSPALSVYGVGADVLKTAGTAAAWLFPLGVGVAAIWGMVYAELGSAFPYAGGDYVGVGTILGPWAGFASLTLWTLIAGPSLAFTATITADYVGELAPALPHTAVTFGSLGAALVVALLAVRASAIVTGVFLAIELAAVLALVVAGFAHPVRGIGQIVASPVALDATGVLAPVGLGAIALGAVNAAFATCGGNQAIGFGEELHDPHRNMGNVLLLAALGGALATALPVVALVVGTHDLVAVLGSPAPFSAFVASAAGPTASRALSAAVALAVFNAMIAGIMFCARLFFSLGRDDIFHPDVNRLLARVEGRSGAPRPATLVVGAVSAACCLLDSHTLVVFIGGSLPYILALASLSVLVGRRRRMTGGPAHWRSPLYPLAPALGLCIATALFVADLLDADVGRPSTLILGGAIAVALLWHRFVVSRRPGGWAPRLVHDPRAAD